MADGRRRRTIAALAVTLLAGASEATSSPSDAPTADQYGLQCADMAHGSEIVRNCVAVQKPGAFNFLRAQAQLNVEPKHSEGSASVQLRWLRLTRSGMILEQIGAAEPQPMGEDYPVYEHYTSPEACGPRGVWQAWVSWTVAWSDGSQEGLVISTPHLSGLCG